MNNDKSITISRVINASREEVWNAWTNPEQIIRWYGPESFTVPYIKSDLTVGGKYVFGMRGPAGSEWDRVMYSAGVFKQIEPMEMLVTTDYFSDENGNKIRPDKAGMDPNFPDELEVTVRFEAVDKDKTRLTIKYQEPRSEAQLKAIKESGMVEGWNSSLNKMEKVVER